MNPQLEQYLEDFERLDGDEDGIGGMEPSKLHDVDNTSSTSPVVNDDDGQINSTRKIVLANPLLVGFLVLPLVMTVAEWMQVFQLNLQVRIGTTTFFSIPGAYLLLGMTATYILVKKDPQEHEHPSKTHAKNVKKQPSLSNNPSRTLFTATSTTINSNVDEGGRKKRQHDCRCELSSLLGSIGAPLLRPSSVPQRDTTVDNNYSSLDDQWYSTVEKLAMAHADLIRTIDTSMEILKMGTALHIGATESTAERVERALFGRRQRQQQLLESTMEDTSISLSTSMPVSFASIRSLVTGAMLSQVGSLLLFANASTLDPSSEDSATMASLGPDDVLGGVPSVITLSWLRASRQQAAALLSYVLEELVQTKNCGGGVDDLHHSIQVAQELRLHLLHAIGLGDDGGQSSKRDSDSERCSTDPNNSGTVLKSHLSKLQTHYRKLFIALWAMEDSITKATGETVLEEEKPTVCETTKDWWNQVNALNDDAVASLQDLEITLFQSQVSGAINEDEQEANMDLHSQTKSNIVQNYTVETSSLQPEVPVQKVTSTKATKTAVFSGKGVVEPQSRRQKKSSSSTTTSQQSSSSAAILQKDPIAQHFLLGELRTRLQTLSLPEEEHEVKDDEVDAPHASSGPSVARRHAPVKKTTAIPLFGGASGSLLVGELKNTVNQLGGQHSIGDDDDDDDGPQACTTFLC